LRQKNSRRDAEEAIANKKEGTDMKKKLLVAGITVIGAILMAGCTQEKGLPDLEIDIPEMEQVSNITPAEPESEAEVDEPSEGEVYETLKVTWEVDENAEEDACSVYIDMAGVAEELPGADSATYIAVDADGNTLYECTAYYGDVTITIYKTVVDKADEHAYEIRIEPNHPMDADKYNAELEVIRKAEVNGIALGDEYMVRGQTGVWYGLIKSSDKASVAEELNNELGN
jgi:hypothetical protein